MSEISIAGLVSHLGTTDSSVGIVNPATGKNIYELAQQSADQVKAAVTNARLAQLEWQNVSVFERAKILLKFHDLLVANETKLLDLLQLETGKARSHAFEEYAGALNAARYFGKIAPKTLKREKTKAGVPVLTRTFVDHNPIGVVGVITPWNYPLALTVLDVMPALAAGNAVVQKADNQTALTTLFARHLAVEAGIPSAAYTVVVGDGPTVGNAITDSVDYVAFTGSSATGRIVAERAASRLIGFSLELGGKNPLIVLRGASLERAAEIALAGAFGSAGQLCVSIERVYVPSELKDDFTAALARRVESLKVGRSSDFSRDVGTLTSASQLNRVDSFVQDAVDHGATLISGGKALPELGPFFYAPTVITDLTDDMRMNRNEVFGPIIQVYGYEDIDSAVNLANDTALGLNASIVGPEAEAIRLASRLDAGSVNINEGFRATFASMDSPMGGMKDSGSGRRNGPGGLLRFTEAKTIGVAGGLLKLPTRGHHYNRMAPLLRLLTKILRRLP